MIPGLNFFQKQILAIKDDKTFNECALELFHHQSKKVSVYREFIELLPGDFSNPKHFSEVPFLPVTLFRNQIVTDNEQIPGLCFSSSGTTGQVTSKHYVAEPEIYRESLQAGFRYFYGSPERYCVLALLPSYLERSGSSLVFMVQQLMDESGHPENGFFLNNHDELAHTIRKITTEGKRLFLIGVTYALLDFFEKYPIPLPADSIVMETGGMKGTRKELIKPEIHQLLISNTGLQKIHSEYGMTELLSQAYSDGDGIFKTPPWMKIMTGDLHDPLSLVGNGETGLLKIIDLANIHSCAFIETQDLGRVKENTFEVMGRMDHSEWRGCNLMVW